MTTLHIVRSIEGRMVPHPFARGRRIGYESFTDDSKELRFETGKLELVTKWKKTDNQETVEETTDFFLRRAIEYGDLEYIATIQRNGGKERTFEDPSLVRFTVRAKQAAKEAAEAAAKREAELEANTALELKAAKLGLSVEELVKQEAASASPQQTTPVAVSEGA